MHLSPGTLNLLAAAALLCACGGQADADIYGDADSDAPADVSASDDAETTSGELEAAGDDLDSQGEDDASGDPSGDPSGESESESDESDAQTEASSAGDADGNTDADSGTPSACQGIDLVFAIGDNNLIDEYQAKLAAAAPAFVDGLQNEFAPIDGLHIGVMHNGLTDEPGLSPACRTHGTLAMWSEFAYCGPFEGGNYLLGTEPELDTSLDCLLNFGEESSSFEQEMITAIGTGLSAENSDPQLGCNPGFMRDDALLVIVMLVRSSETQSYPAQELADTIIGTKDAEQWVVHEIGEIRGGFLLAQAKAQVEDELVDGSQIDAVVRIP